MPTYGQVSGHQVIACLEIWLYDLFADYPPYLEGQIWLNSTELTYRMFFEDCAKVLSYTWVTSHQAQFHLTDRSIFVPAYERRGRESFRHLQPGGSIHQWAVRGALACSRRGNPRHPHKWTRAEYAPSSPALFIAYTHMVPPTAVFFMRTLENPGSWGMDAQAFHAAMNGNASAVLDALALQAAGDPTDLQRSAVTCNDERPFAPPAPESLVKTALESLQSISRFYYSAIITEPDSGCQYWPFTPPERYLGPWNNTPKNPILIISNTVSELPRRRRLLSELAASGAQVAVIGRPHHALGERGARALVLPQLFCAPRARWSWGENALLPH